MAQRDFGKALECIKLLPHHWGMAYGVALTVAAGKESAAPAAAARAAADAALRAMVTDYRLQGTDYRPYSWRVLIEVYSR